MTSILGQILNGINTDDNYGFSVSSSANGEIIAASALNSDVNGIQNSGLVRVYILNTTDNTWTQLGDDISGSRSNDNFGYSMKMSNDGSRIIIGSPFTDIGRSNSGTISLYEYNSNNNEWNQIGSSISGSFFFRGLGYKSSISGNGTTIAGSGINGIFGINFVSIYTYDESRNRLVSKGSTLLQFNNGFGSDISLNFDGSIVAIGAPSDDNNRNNSGSVYVYAYNGSSWVLLGNRIDGNSSNQNFGSSLELDDIGTTLIVGSPGDDNGNGSASVYRLNTETMIWETYGQKINGDTNSTAGFSVSITNDSNGIAIGIPQFVNESLQETGCINVYEYNTEFSRWDMVNVNVDISGLNDGDRYGNSVSISYNDTEYVIVGGAPNASQGGGDLPLLGLLRNDVPNSGQVIVHNIQSPQVCNYGTVGDIQNFYMVNDDNGNTQESTYDTTDYQINCSVNLYNIFNSVDLTDQNGFIIDQNGLLNELQNSSIELLDSFNRRIDIVRNSSDLTSWLDSNSNQKFWLTEDLIPNDFTLVENQHFTLKQKNGPNGNGFYSIPRGGLFDKLIRVFLHSMNEISVTNTPNYYYVSKLVMDSLSEQQNTVSVFSEGTDIYHKTIVDNIETKINASNIEFKTQLYEYIDCLLEKLYFDWSSYTWTNGSLANTYQLQSFDGIINIDFLIGGETSSIISGFPRIDSVYMGNDDIMEDTLTFNADINTLVQNTNEITIDIDFQQTVYNVGFKIYDIDGVQGSYEEQFVIEGFDNGTVVYPSLTTITTTSTISVNEQTGTIVGSDPIAAAGTGAAEGVVLIRFNSPIDSLKITSSVLLSQLNFNITDVLDFTISDIEVYVHKTIDETNVNLDNTSMVFYFDYRFKKLTFDEINPDDTLYNNNDPNGVDPTDISTSDELRTICLKLTHDGSSNL